MTHETHINQPEDQLPYDYNDLTGFAPFGTEALMQDQRGLVYGEDVPKKVGAFTKAFVEQKPNAIESEVAQRLNGPRVSPEGDESLLKLEIDARSARSLAEKADMYTHDELEKVRDALGDLTEFHTTKLEASFTLSLAKDDQTSARELFTRWNSGQKQWVDWLATDPAEGGATDEQLKNVLQWNEYQFRKINNDPRNQERLKLFEQCYEVGLVEAVAKGELHKQLLDNYDTQPKPTVVIADPLSLAMLGNHGFIHQTYNADDVEGRSIILERDWGALTYLHERTHMLGRLKGDSLTNEASTDLIARKVHKHSPVSAVEPFNSTYTDEEDILDAYMTFAAVDVYEVSEFYANRDGEGMIKRLGDGLKSGDYIGSRKEFIDDIKELAKRNNITASEGTILNRVAARVQELKRDVLSNLQQGVQ